VEKAVSAAIATGEGIGTSAMNKAFWRILPLIGMCAARQRG